MYEPGEFGESLRCLRERRPLIHQISNYVTINDCANITLAIGASPVMAEDVSEVEEMVSSAAALVLNMGMPNSRKIEAMLAAGRQAMRQGIPIIFDPVGAGATKLRIDAADRILTELKITAIRGNLSEIKTLLGIGSGTRGVDCIEPQEDNQALAKKLSAKLDSVVAITGPTDVIAYNNEVCYVHNGTELLAGVTGTGCMTTALIACFCSVANNAFAGTITGVAAMGVAGELAQQELAKNEGLGTFHMRLFDAVSNLTPEILMHRMKVKFLSEN